MPNTQAEDPVYSFAGGLVTDQSPVAPVPGSSTDCYDYEINTDGSIQRRKGILQEEGGLDVDISTPAGDEAFSTVIWTGAGGDPAYNIRVVQHGLTLLFFEETANPSESAPIASVSLVDIAVEGVSTASVRASALTYASSRGRLLIAGRYIETTLASFDGADVVVTPIEIRTRDFTDVDDGLTMGQWASDNTDEVLYNLYNRGWTDDDITQFNTDTGTYPAKNMWPQLGFQREADAGVQEGYGKRVWSSDKLAGEFFGSATAPRGHLLLNPFNTTVGYLSSRVSNTVSATHLISTWSGLDTSGGTTNPQTITINLTTPHGFGAPSAVSIVDNKYRYRYGIGKYWVIDSASLNGDYTATPTGANQITISYNRPKATKNWAGFYNQYHSKGALQVYASGGATYTVTRPSGYTTTERPAVVAWYAGRAWYAGMAHVELTDQILFSQVVDDTPRYGACYQSNDPTAENFNSVLATDGGVIRIPGLSGVKRAEVIGGSLVLFATTGIWEISGGQEGFSATSYVVRKISDAEVLSATGVVHTDFGVVAATKRGVWAVSGDPNSGLLGASSLSFNKVDGFWNSLSDEVWTGASIAYDDIKKRVHVLLPRSGDNPNQMTESLVLDLRLGEGGAFYRTRLPFESGTGWVIGAFGVHSTTSESQESKMKYVAIYDDGGQHVLRVLDSDNVEFTDEFGDEYIPYWRSTSGNIDNWHKHKYASHYAYTHVKRTVTGYSIGETTTPVNPGSCYIQGLWNWSDNGISGKETEPQQMYREARTYEPSSETDVGGEPVIVRRHKIRGSGRSLTIKITGEAGYDSHVLGWVLQYGIG